MDVKYSHIFWFWTPLLELVEHQVFQGIFEFNLMALEVMPSFNNFRVHKFFSRDIRPLGPKVMLDSIRKGNFTL